LIVRFRVSTSSDHLSDSMKRDTGDRTTMGKRLGQLGCFCLLLAVGGCKGMFGRQGLPPDPLFAVRKPIESKAQAGPPAETPFTEPMPPAKMFFTRPQ
jgi:hypothetical protein